MGNIGNRKLFCGGRRNYQCKGNIPQGLKITVKFSVKQFTKNTLKGGGNKYQFFVFTAVQMIEEKVPLQQKLKVMYAATFTKDPQRLSRLRQNYEEGVERESLPEAQRVQLDKDIMTPSDEYVANLFNGAFAKIMARKAARLEGVSSA